MKSHTPYGFQNLKPTLEENHEILYSRAIKWFISIIFRENLTTCFWIILPCSTYWWRHFFPKISVFTCQTTQHEILWDHKMNYYFTSNK